MTNKFTDTELEINDFDKERLTKIEDFIADIAEPYMEIDDYYIFNNEILNEFFAKLLAKIGNIKEKSNISDLIDEEGYISIKIKPQDLRHRRIFFR